ncbi:Cyclin PHO80-like [Phaffia rhodozyma]|uniref:Cyclin PHO80-like n=1 Tax=Phaffia rhodozyma TaxID=264483 RepID=A0A0F7SHN4_PHARH|nr:Cyclin PHO80-like [Phaffia rhodozyma]
MTKTFSEGRMVETDFERSNSQNSGSGRTTPDPPFGALPLCLNNTAQMYKLMEFRTTPRYCKLTVETIQGLISRNEVISPKKKKLERDVLVEYLFYWTSMTLHPFIILICTVQYVELLKYMHPSISFTGKVQDAILRVMFSAFLIATKMVSDVCYANAAFIRHTPWTLEEINSMEAELLVHIQYRSFISPVCLLRRAKDFWAQPHEDTHSPGDEDDDDDDDDNDETPFGPTLSSYDILSG